MIGDTMQYPASSDYIYGGAPFIVAVAAARKSVSSRRAGQSRSEAAALGGIENACGRSRATSSTPCHRTPAELGDIGPDTIIPISRSPKT
jgi:hypothetical protein